MAIRLSQKRWVVLGVLVVLILGGLGASLWLVTQVTAQTAYSATVTYKASGAGNQDDMAIWVHPTNRSQSTVIGSDKHGDVYVYNMDGSTLQTITPPGSEPGNIDVRYNFPLGGQLVDIVGHNRREGNDQIVLYKVNSDRTLTRVDDNITTSATYGFCFYHSLSSGKFYGIKTAKSGAIGQYELSDNGSGGIRGNLVRSFNVGSQTEGCVADDEAAALYMGEEGKSGVGAIWKYGAEPNAGSTRTKVDDTNGHLNKDVEGVTIYHTSGGGGYIIASSQGASRFDVYNLQSHNYVTSFKVSGASGTDGIDVSNVSLGSTFPQGVFLAHSGGSSIRGVPWQTIANGEGLTIDTSWDPRGGQVPPTPTPGDPTSTPTQVPTPTTPPGTPPTPTPILSAKGILAGYGTTNSLLDQFTDGLVNILDWLEFLNPTTQPTPTPTGSQPTVTPTPSGPTPTFPPPGTGQGIWISPQRLASLPTSGSAWNNVKSKADGSCPSPNLSDQNNQSDVCVMAKALVYARTGVDSYRTQVKNYIQAAMGTEGSGGGQYNVAALGRNGIAFIISADLIDLKNYDPSFDASFRSWLSQARYKNMDGWVLASGGASGRNCTEKRPNNIGMHCAATAAAAAAYLNDTPALQRSADIFKGWLGDRSSYAGFDYGSLSWQCNSSSPVGINPQGCTKQGFNIDGVLPDDQRRGGSFTSSPPCENYVREALQGALAQAIILHQQGYPTWEWENQALKRAATWFTQAAGCSFTGDDQWEPWVFNYYYGTNFSAPTSASPGKNVGWTDWTHAR